MTWCNQVIFVSKVQALYFRMKAHLCFWLLLVSLFFLMVIAKDLG